MSSNETRRIARLLIAAMVIGALWLVIILKLGVAGATRKPVDSILSYTFNSWSELPVNRHYFLAQYDSTDFSQGKAYTSSTYPLLFSMFVLVAPFHFFWKLPYNVAHNFIAYFYVICLSLLLVFKVKNELLEMLDTKSLLLAVFAFLAIGIVVTNPLPWVSLLVYGRDSLPVLAAAAFCYLSTWVFYDHIPGKPLLIIGIFLALWAPIYIPAWILAGIFFQRTLIPERKWIILAVAVAALAWFNLKLPLYVCNWAGLISTGSGFPYRSGLDGSTTYFSSIQQAVFQPIEARYWSTAFYVILTIVLGIGFHVLFRQRERHPLQQAFFLIIPYATMAIILPQATSIHPYFTDLMLFIPATFLIAFWFLQREFWQKLKGKTYVAWLLLASLILMTNLLTIAQNLSR
jgi:hypothetical protein